MKEVTNILIIIFVISTLSWLVLEVSSNYFYNSRLNNREALRLQAIMTCQELEARYDNEKWSYTSCNKEINRVLNILEINNEEKI